MTPGRDSTLDSAPSRIGVACLLLSAISLIFAPAANAENPPDPDLSTKEMRRLGPMLVKPKLLVKDVGYDDNIRFDAQVSEGDFTATIAPGVDALFLAGNRGGVRIAQDFDYVAFRTNTDLNHLNSTTRARGILVLRPAVVSLEERYSYVEERPSTEVDQRLRRKENGLTAAIHAQPRARIGLQASLRAASIDFTSSIAAAAGVARRLNRNERSGSVAGDYRILPKTRLTLEGNLKRVDFEDASAGRGAEARSVLSGLAFDSSAAIQGSIKAGVVDLHAPDSPENDHRETVGEALLSSRLSRVGRVKVEAVRKLTVSAVPGFLFFVETRWSASYEQFFSPRTSAEILYGRGFNRYPDGVPISSGPAPGVPRQDDIITYEIALKYRMGRQYALIVGAKRLVRDSNVDSLDRDRNLYTIGSTFEF